MNTTTTIHKGHTIISGLIGAGFYAKSCGIYEGGYISELRAINAVKRKLNKRDEELLTK
jgi:hypothetical protein